MKKNRKSSTKGKEAKNFKKEIIQSIIPIGSHCITFNKKQNIPIWNYMLREDRVNIFVFDEEDNVIYDGLLIEAPDRIFKHGDTYANVTFAGLDVEDNIVSRQNFFLFEKQLTEKGVF